MSCRHSLLAFLGLAVLTLASLRADEPKDKPAAKAFEPIEIKGMLTSTDPLDRKRNAPCKLHRFDFVQGKTYVIDLISGMAGYDPYLRLEDPKGNPLAEDDDSGGNLNARIIFTAPVSGNYQVSATSFNGVGPYTLKIRLKE